MGCISNKQLRPYSEQELVLLSKLFGTIITKYTDNDIDGKKFYYIPRNMLLDDDACKYILNIVSDNKFLVNRNITDHELSTMLSKLEGCNIENPFTYMNLFNLYKDEDRAIPGLVLEELPNILEDVTKW